MDTFLRLASLGTLIVGLQLVIPDKSSATVISNQHREFSSIEKSIPVLPIYNAYTPPDNGGPSRSGNQGSGTR